MEELERLLRPVALNGRRQIWIVHAFQGITINWDDAVQITVSV